MARVIRTWRVGEVGLMGTRRVAADGSVTVGGSRGSSMQRRVFRGDRLASLIGEIVMFHDCDRSDGRWSFHLAEWLTNGGVVQGRFICYAAPIDV